MVSIMSIYIYIHIHTYTHIYIHAHRHTYTYIYIHIHTFIHEHRTHTHNHIYIYMHICVAIGRIGICVADPSRERRNRDNSWLQFNVFIQTNWGTAAPTQPQSVGGNYSPANALKPRILTYINYSSTVSQYIYSQVLVSIIHPRTSLITFHIIHISFPYYKYVHSCQERRLDWLCGNPAFPTPAEPCGSANQSEGPASQSRANRADERTNQRADSGAHVNCLTSSVAIVPDIT